MVRPVTFEFTTVTAPAADDADEIRRQVPAKSGVFRVFDVHDRLILLDKTHNLRERIERFHDGDGATRALDLRGIAARFEYCRTDSPFETLYLLHAQRRRWFPRTYHRMRTIPRFYLLKINPRQRFPRIYTARQVKRGVRYFGPFASRAELERVKTTLERAFRLRPCEYNIRGDRPYPDCLYFQMRTCSKPCNGEIGRDAYMADLDDAVAFVQGRDEAVRRPMIEAMERLAAETRFEEAARVRKRLERVERARRDCRDAYLDLGRFDFVVVMRSASTRTRKLAIVHGGSIAAIEEHAVDGMEASVPRSVERAREAAGSDDRRQRVYEDFCLVSHFRARPVASVDIVPLADGAEGAVESIAAKIRASTARSTKAQAPHRA